MKWSWQLKTLINLQILLRISFDHFITWISTEKFIKPWKRFSLYWICKSYLGNHFVKQLHNTLYTIHTSEVYRNSHKLLVSWDAVELRKLRKNIHFASKQLTTKLEPKGAFFIAATTSTLPPSRTSSLIAVCYSHY